MNKDKRIRDLEDEVGNLNKKMRNAKADIARVGDITDLGTFSNFATIALPHWIDRATIAERDRDIYAATARELQTQVKWWADKYKKLEAENEALRAKLEAGQ